MKTADIQLNSWKNPFLRGAGPLNMCNCNVIMRQRFNSNVIGYVKVDIIALRKLMKKFFLDMTPKLWKVLCKWFFYGLETCMGPGTSSEMPYIVLCCVLFSHTVHCRRSAATKLGTTTLRAASGACFAFEVNKLRYLYRLSVYSKSWKNYSCLVVLTTCNLQD